MELHRQPLGARLGSFLAFLDAGDDLVAGQIAVGLDGLAARVAGLHAERLRDFTRTHFAEQRDRDEPQPGTQTEQRSACGMPRRLNGQFGARLKPR